VKFVLAVATTKGGPGKTTLAMSLADYLNRTDTEVICLDTDPNKNLTSWVNRTGAFICRAVAEDDVIDAITDARKVADVVIVDVAGAQAKALVYAVGVADFVLIPVRPDHKDVAEAMRTMQHVTSAIKHAQVYKPDAYIQHAAVLSQINRRANVTQHTRDQLATFGIPVLAADIPFRTAYQSMSFIGLPAEDPTIREDVGAVLAEIKNLLRASHA
jgi:chromosome partitioning protein